MTDMNASTADFASDVARKAPFKVEEIFWGYKIRSGSGVPLAVMLGQAVCFFFGVCLMTASFGVLVLPTLFFDGGAGIMRVGAATLMGAAAFYLLWFASRGTLAEVHVNTSLDEIREVVCNRAGKPTTVAAYGFEEIGGVFIEENDETNRSQLIMRYRNTSQTVLVAEGTHAQLMPLRDQLAHDLLGTTIPMNRDAA